MSLRCQLQHTLARVGDSALLSPLLRRPALRSWLEPLPGGRAVYPQGWDRTHPFDRLNGTDTSGTEPPEDFSAEAAVHGTLHSCGSSQPSVLRRALEAVPDLQDCVFLDLGCGKGRPVLVAAAFPFRALIGVELSPKLAAIARRNVARVARRHAARSRPRIETGDALAFPLPEVPLLIFLYNPFGRPLIERLVQRIEVSLAEQPRPLHVVYYNPVHGDCFDAAPALHRHHAAMLAYAPEELGYGPDAEDAVVIWSSAAAAARPGAEARIVVTVAGTRAGLAARENETSA